jgi:hypothetical protein
MLPQALSQIPCATDVQVTVVLAEQIDAGRRGIAWQRGDRQWHHCHKPLERRVERLHVPDNARSMTVDLIRLLRSLVQRPTAMRQA